MIKSMKGSIWIEKWYAIVTIINKGNEKEKKLYYRRRSTKRLIFTDEIMEAKPFKTQNQAEKFLLRLPELVDDIEMTVEVQTLPRQNCRRLISKRILEME